MVKEKAYDFRKRLTTVHQPNLRNSFYTPSSNEFVVADGMAVSIPENAGEVIVTAANDFVDYMRISMGINISVSRGEKRMSMYVLPEILEKI